MPIPIAAGLISALPNILSGVFSKKARDKQSDLLGSTTLDMPTGMIDAENILRESATQGLPGYEKYKGDIMGSMSQGLSAYKDVIDNPAAILGALSTSQTNVNDALSELAIKDSLAKLENEKTLASFLGGQKANTQMQIDQYGDQMKIMAGEEKQRGVADLLQGITNGISSGISTYGGMKKLDFTKELLSKISASDAKNALVGDLLK